MATGFRYGAKALVTVNAVDLSAYCDDAGLDVGIETAETTTFNSSWKTFIEETEPAEPSRAETSSRCTRTGARPLRNSCRRKCGVSRKVSSPPTTKPPSQLADHI